jgi:scyllo-inositol 2-dehydrogenase (NADP+)
MAKKKQIGIGIVGLGRAGWGMHCSELDGKQDMFKIVAVCDLIEDRCKQAADKYGCRTYSDVRDLIADRDVEMVDIATRSCDHVAHTSLALAAGKDVFLEKPICLTYTEAKRLVKLNEASRGNLYIRHNRRYEPGFQHIREIIASGILGDVYEIKLRRVSYQRRDDWQTLMQFGGGQLLNWGPHIIDHALRFLESPVKSIWSDLKKVAAVGDAEDHLKIVLTGRNGRVIDIEISGGAAIGEPEYLVWGTRGALKSSGNEIELRYIRPDQVLSRRRPNPETPGTSFSSPDHIEWVEEKIPVNPADPVDMTTIWDELYDAVRNGADFRVKLSEAVEVMKVVSEVKKGTKFEVS